MSRESLPKAILVGIPSSLHSFIYLINRKYFSIRIVDTSNVLETPADVGIS